MALDVFSLCGVVLNSLGLFCHVLSGQVIATLIDVFKSRPRWNADGKQRLFWAFAFEYNR